MHKRQRFFVAFYSILCYHKLILFSKKALNTEEE